MVSGFYRQVLPSDENLESDAPGVMMYFNHSCWCIVSWLKEESDTQNVSDFN
jgi:hypothetical protein